MALKDERIAKAKGKDSIAIVGDHAKIVESEIINDVSLEIQQVNIGNQYNIINSQNIPIHFDPEDLLIIIKSFKDYIDILDESSFGKDFLVITIDEKNELNHLSIDYYEDCIKESAAYFIDINNFLTDPKNRKLKRAYYTCASAIRGKIIAYNKHSMDFDIILQEVKGEFLQKLSTEIQGKSRTASIVVDFMYCNCDIGKKTKI